MQYNLFKNKKAGEEILSIWWFLVLAIIGAGIVSGVLLFYSAEFDVRQAEADILYETVAGCLIKDGSLINEALYNDFNLAEKCGLKKSLFEEESDFLIKVVFNGEGGELRAPIVLGKTSFEGDCTAVEKTIKARYYPKCAKKSVEFYYYQDGIKLGKLDILTASNQMGVREARA